MSSENYRIEKQDAVYFLTFTVSDWVDVFTRMNYRSIITKSLEFCRKNKGLKLYDLGIDNIIVTNNKLLTPRCKRGGERTPK
jgi:hypothetical protein